MCIFGPVPSRRLGSSLGINNIPYKICTYTCAYCQIGPTLRLELKRKRYSDPEKIANSVKKKLLRLAEKGEKVDYITLVPDGEPTLDIALGELLTELRKTSIPVAVITNSSLIWESQVREALMLADWVSLKIDAISEDVWRSVDRPHPALKHDEILEGMKILAADFTGKLCTETMLVRDLNDAPEELEKIADFISNYLNPYTAYISVPTRPPAASWVLPPKEEAVTAAYAIYKKKGLTVETLTGYEGNEFVITDNPAEEILNITAVHPMRSDAIEKVLRRWEADEQIIEDLVDEGKIKRVEYEGNIYYLRVMGDQKEKKGALADGIGSQPRCDR